jgi:predicted DNA-binding protein
MELTKKTTILFSPEQHDRLTQLAAQRGTSLGDLVREACEKQYGVVPVGDRLAAVAALAALDLPVGSPADLERESVPFPDDLLP